MVAEDGGRHGEPPGGGGGGGGRRDMVVMAGDLEGQVLWVSVVSTILLSSSYGLFAVCTRHAQFTLLTVSFQSP